MLESVDFGILLKFTTFVFPLVISVIIHEVSHGLSALYFGDDTAKKQNRLSLNPIKHIDLFGTIILPVLLFLMSTGFMFGWAKPVPVNFSKLKKPKRDMIFVAFAGPLSNILLAIFSAALLKNISFDEQSIASMWVLLNLVNMVMINIVLAIFNLIPVPPLDGSKILTGILPMSLAKRYISLEKYGMLIVIFLLFILPSIGNFVGLDLDVFRFLISNGSRYFLGLLG